MKLGRLGSLGCSRGTTSVIKKDGSKNGRREVRESSDGSNYSVTYLHTLRSMGEGKNEDLGTNHSMMFELSASSTFGTFAPLQHPLPSSNFHL